MYHWYWIFVTTRIMATRSSLHCHTITTTKSWKMALGLWQAISHIAIQPQQTAEIWQWECDRPSPHCHTTTTNSWNMVLSLAFLIKDTIILSPGITVGWPSDNDYGWGQGRPFRIYRYNTSLLGLAEETPERGGKKWTARGGVCLRLCLYEAAALVSIRSSSRTQQIARCGWINSDDDDDDVQGTEAQWLHLPRTRVVFFPITTVANTYVICRLESWDAPFVPHFAIQSQKFLLLFCWCTTVKL